MIRKISCAGAMLFAASLLVSCSPANYPTKPIELKYYANGPWAVTVSIGSQCCDSAGDKFDLYYPTNLGQGALRIRFSPGAMGLARSRQTTPIS